MPYRIAGICLSSDNYSSDPFSKGSLAFETRMDRLLDSEGGPVCIIQGMLRLNRPMKWRKSSLLTLATSPEDGRRTLSKNPDKILCIGMGAIVLISIDSNFPLFAINYPVKVDRGNGQNHRHRDPGCDTRDTNLPPFQLTRHLSNNAKIVPSQRLTESYACESFIRWPRREREVRVKKTRAKGWVESRGGFFRITDTFTTFLSLPGTFLRGNFSISDRRPVVCSIRRGLEIYGYCYG